MSSISSVCGRFGELVVLLSRHQGIKLLRIGDADADQPGVTER